LGIDLLLQRAVLANASMSFSVSHGTLPDTL
jgi:hypothetical protein